MQRRRAHAAAAAVAMLALVGGGLTVAQAPAGAGERTPVHDSAARATLPAGFRDATAIGGISQPVTAAFAPDGTAFIGLQTGVIKSFDFDAASGAFEAAATSTDFADLSDRVSNYGDRGLTGITVDPQFGTAGHDYVYVNYTYNADPQNPDVFPAWGTPGQAYDNCGPDDADEARIPSSDTDPDQTYRRGCPVMDRVSRLTAVRSALGWEMVPGSEHVLVQDGCAQFSSHSSGDVAFGPDGRLYASAGDGASFRNTDYGQANAQGYPAACPGDPVDEGGSLRAQDQRTDHGPTDPLGIDGTIFKLDPNLGLAPSQATASQWLVAMGQRNPWRFTFRQGGTQLWSVDVGSSNWEEINKLDDGPTAALINRGWPCYEGTTGQSLVTPQWQALTPPKQICTDLYAAQAIDPQTVRAPFFSYRTRIGFGPITPGENCPSPTSSSAMSGIAFSGLGTGWPSGYQDALFFSDFLRGCIWRFEKDANGQPDATRVHVFAQAAGAPVDLLAGPGGDLYYVDYGSFTGSSYDAGSGGVHRISWVGATSLTTSLTVKSSPRKVRIKVAGTRHRTPYRSSFEPGTLVKLLAPRTYAKKGVHYVFAKWKGVKGKHRKKRRLALTIGDDAVTLKAVYDRVRRRQA
jgi:glucose/arabinose dehydrogenase